MENLIKRHFDKRFGFDKSNANWKLPLPCKLWTGEKWNDDVLASMKDELNAVKSKLNDKERGPWRLHTQSTNPAGSIVVYLRRRFKPQLCTQAWAKCFEMLSNYEDCLFSNLNQTVFNSIHLCEAPGAFITALNHFLSLRMPHVKKKWRWIGSTLNPYYEENSQKFMIADDRFILHTMENWEFGEDNTGNIMNVCNLRKMITRAKKLGEISLITADGSIDCDENFAEQEVLVSWLHYCEAVTALLILKNHGNFIMKMFTSFENHAVSLLYFLNCAFNEVHLFKPGTSKEGNSEIYVICLDYHKHVIQTYEQALQSVFGSQAPKKVFLGKDLIPNDFLEQIYHSSKFFKDMQMAVINRNLELYPNMSFDNRQYHDQLQSSCCCHFVNSFKVHSIEEKHLLVQRKKMKPLSPDLFPKNTLETYNDVILRSQLQTEEKQNLMEKKLLNLMHDNWSPESLITCEVSLLEKNLNINAELLKFERPVHQILSSRFGYQYLLNLWNEVTAETNLPNEVWFQTDMDAAINEHVQSSINDIWVLDVTNSDYCNISNPSSQFKKINLRERLKSINLTAITLEKYLWIECLLFILQNVQQNDTVILITGNFLSRFVVGSLYIFTLRFQKAKLIRPLCVPPLDPKGLVIATDFREKNRECVSEFLKHVQDKLLQEKESESLLEIVPVQRLINDEKFYKWLYDFNKAKMGQQLYFLFKKLKSRE